MAIQVETYSATNTFLSGVIGYNLNDPVILSEVDNKYYVTLKYGAKTRLRCAC